MQDDQRLLPVAPPTGEAPLLRVGWGLRPGAEPFRAKTLRSAGPPSISHLESSSLGGFATIVHRWGTSGFGDMRLTQGRVDGGA